MGRYDESIRLSEGIEAGDSEQHRALTANRALCLYERGDYPTCVKSFEEMAADDPKALLPPVYLSKLYLQNRDVDRGLAQCDKLLSLLGLDRNRTLDRLVELGGVYVEAGHRLTELRDSGLARICFEIGAMLGYQGKEQIVV